MAEAFREDRSVLTRTARAPDHCVRYGTQPEHVADIWQGTAAARTRPLVVVIHGGFWRPQYDRTHTGPMCAAIADAGWTVATVEYRRAPGQPDATTGDVRAAIAALPTLTKHHDGRVIVMGHSAGGHLGLYAAAVKTSPFLIGVIALAPAADLQLVDSLDLDNGAARDFLGVAATARPELDPAQLPDIAVPTLLIHGIEDAVVPIAVSRAYIDRHPAAELRTLEHCGHFAPIDPLSAAWPAVVAALERLGDPLLL